MELFLFIPILITGLALTALLVLILVAYIVTNKPFKVISLNRDAIDFIDDLQREWLEEDEDVTDY